MPREAAKIAKKSREEIENGSEVGLSYFLAVPAVKKHPGQKAELKADDERKNQSRRGRTELPGMGLGYPAVGQLDERNHNDVEYQTSRVGKVGW